MLADPARAHTDIVRLLLEKGAHPNVAVESSADTLSFAISRSDQEMIDLLCSHGAARSVELLAYSGDVPTAAAVFAANPSLASDAEALSNAAGNGHESFVRLMLRYQPTLPGRVGVAAKTGELTELLFAAGMNPSHPNWLHVTPLHQFAKRGDLENAKLFLEQGAELNARDEELSSTPLGWAAKAGRTQMAEFLLRQGAKTNLDDDPPWATPLSWASRRGHHHVATLLERHGAT